MSAAQIPVMDYYSHGATTRRAHPGDWVEGFSERPNFVPLLFVPSILIAGASWLAGGIQILNDLAMIIFTCVLAGLFLNEVFMFPRRFGIGGIIAFGGGLLWWCYDYHTHWLGYRGELTGDQMFSLSNIDSVPAWVLGKGVCLYTLFMCCVSIGLRAKKHLWLSRLAYKTIEPNSSFALFIVVIVVFFLSLIPYFFTEDGFFQAIGLQIISGYGSGGPRWTTGRTGSVNYNWGGYLTELVRLGYAGATMAAFHASLFTRSRMQKIVCYAIFVLQVALAFGTGARGNVVFTCLPLAIILFLKYNFVAAEMARKFSKRAYIVTLSLLFGMLFLIQVQGYFRNEGFSVESFKNVEVADLRGNEMFTTSLPGFAVFPSQSDFIDEPFFRGSGFIVALPRTFYWFAIGPIPRALWNNKPIDNTWSKYNAMTTGRAESDSVGTTISRGAAGDPYFRWGIGGLIQVAWLYGLILRNCEVGIRSASGRPITLLFLLGFATFIFRAFRDLSMQDIYPVFIGTFAMCFFSYIFNLLGGRTAR